MSAMTSHDPQLRELLKALGAPDLLTSFELTAKVNEVVRVRCEYLQPAKIDGAQLERCVKDFELVQREYLDQLRNMRRALAALSERLRELQPDGTGYLAIGRLLELFAGEIRAARKAEGLPNE